MSIQSFDQDFNNLTITSISSNNSPIFDHKPQPSSNLIHLVNQQEVPPKEFKTNYIKNSQSIKNLENLLDYSINNKSNEVKKILTSETCLNNNNNKFGDRLVTKLDTDSDDRSDQFNTSFESQMHGQIHDIKETKNKKKFNFKTIFQKKKKLSVRNYSSNPNLSNFSSNSNTSLPTPKPMSSSASSINLSGINTGINSSASSNNLSNNLTRKKSIFTLKKKKSMSNLNINDNDNDFLPPKPRNSSFSKPSTPNSPQFSERNFRPYTKVDTHIKTPESSVYKSTFSDDDFKLENNEDVLSFGEEFNMSNMMDDSKGFPYGFGSDNDDDDEPFDRSAGAERINYSHSQEHNHDQESNLEYSIKDKFPKNLDNKEIESIISIERSRSIKSIKNKKTIIKSNSHKKNLNLGLHDENNGDFLSEFKDIINFESDGMEDSFITANSETLSLDSKYQVDDFSKVDNFNEVDKVDKLDKVDKSPIIPINIESPILNSILINESHNNNNDKTTKRPISMSFKKSLFENNHESDESNADEIRNKIHNEINKINEIENRKEHKREDQNLTSLSNDYSQNISTESFQEPKIILSKTISNISNKSSKSHLKNIKHKEIDIKKVRFSSRIILYDTYNEESYNRHPEVSTCNQLTPWLAQQIKDELNLFKSEMIIHDSSRCYTHFF